MACTTMNDLHTPEVPGLSSDVAPPVYLIAGSKGGVGKSMLALVVVDQLQLGGKRVLYFESDNSNPDVWQCLEPDPKNAPGEGISGVTLYTVRLEEEESWADMVNAIEEHRDHVVVIGTASRTTEAIRTHGHILRETMPGLERRLVTLWVIDEQRDSLNQLKEHLTVFPDNEIHVIKNSKEGADAFGLYDGSKLRATIEQDKQGLSRYMPRLALSVRTKVYSDRLCFAKALTVLPTANRYLLSNFRRSCGEMLAPILRLP
jgi:hypothetical protein